MRTAWTKDENNSVGIKDVGGATSASSIAGSRSSFNCFFFF